MSDMSQTCAYPPCNCKVEPSKGVAKDGKLYCCEGCASGQGCQCQDCNCSS